MNSCHQGLQHWLVLSCWLGEVGIFSEDLWKKDGMLWKAEWKSPWKSVKDSQVALYLAEAAKGVSGQGMAEQGTMAMGGSGLCFSRDNCPFKCYDQ